MIELYSNSDDCLSLAKLLKRELKEKIEFCGSTYLEVVSGKYHSLPYNRYDNIYDYKKDELAFSYKFCEDGFLRITVEDSIYETSVGHKLAVLSDLYEVISKFYGMPTLFYTIKDDDENSLNLEWDFIQKEETIDAFKNGTMFDDGEVDELIIIGEEEESVGTYSLSKTTKELISRQIGLPFEMIYLIDQNIEDFVKYKKGAKMSYPKNVKIDGYPIATLESVERKIDVENGPRLSKRFKSKKIEENTED